jgi:cystinosin
LSPDYAVYNVLGFLCYGTYTFAFAYSGSIREAYHEQHDSYPLVSFQDVLFAGHAIVLSIVGLFQILHYDGLGGTQKLSRFGFVTTTVLTTFCLLYGALVLYTKEEHKDKIDGKYDDEYKKFTPLSYMYALSYVKVFITCIKYVPQAYANYSRQSTRGWNVWNVILDFSGGFFSMIQLLGDCAVMDDWSGLAGDIVKFVLGLVSILFDILFLVQHYVLYGDVADRVSFDSMLSDSEISSERMSSTGVRVVGVGAGGVYQKIDSGRGFV